MRHALSFAFAFAIACASSTNDPVRGTEVEGSPLCDAPVPCCAETFGARPPAARAGTATVDAVEVSEMGAEVRLTLDGMEVELSFAVAPDLTVDDALEVTPTDLGLVLRDETGVVAVLGTDDIGYSGAFADAELAIGDEMLRVVLTCHGFVPRTPEFCDDALIADYALELAGVSVSAGRQTDITIDGTTYHLRNRAVRQRVSGPGRECADFWPPMLRFELVRRAN